MIPSIFDNLFDISFYLEYFTPKNKKKFKNPTMKFFSTALFGIGMNSGPFATTHKIYFSYFYTEKISKKLFLIFRKSFYDSIKELFTVINNSPSLVIYTHLKIEVKMLLIFASSHFLVQLH